MKKIIIITIILVLTFLDILTTQYLLNVVKEEFPMLNNHHEIEANPFMRYLMSINSWLWIVVKLAITSVICYIIHINKIGFKVQVIVIILLFATVLGNYLTIFLGGK